MGGTPQGTLTNLGVTINGQTRDITAFGGTTLTVAGALAAAPVAGDAFTVFGTDISGLGRSTFRTPDANVAAGGNVFGLVITNFGTNVTVGGADPGFKMGNSQTFTWSLDATPFTFDP